MCLAGISVKPRKSSTCEHRRVMSMFLQYIITLETELNNSTFTGWQSYMFKFSTFACYLHTLIQHLNFIYHSAPLFVLLSVVSPSQILHTFLDLINLVLACLIQNLTKFLEHSKGYSSCKVNTCLIQNISRSIPGSIPASYRTLLACSSSGVFIFITGVV